MLFQTEGNPVPDDSRVGRLAMPDGKSIRYALFPATGRPLKGTVIVLSGRNEAIEKYFETVRDLTGRGFGVLAFDWRGQGGSDRLIADPMRGYVERFDQFVEDFETLFDEVALPDCRAPFHVLAHSTGALVALLAAPGMVNRVQRMVLLAPLLRLNSVHLPNRWLRRATGLLFSLGLGERYLLGGPRPIEIAPFATNKVTTDPARYHRNQTIYQEHPELALGGPTVAWVHAAMIAADRVQEPEFLARIHVPTLMVAAGAEDIVSNAAIEKLSRRLRSGSLLTIDGARHEILQEADVYREQFFAAFDAFVPGSGPEAA